MKIYSFSRIIAFPFAILFTAILLYSFQVDDQYSIYMIVPGIVLALIFVFQPQIDFWWYRRHTPPLEDPIKSWLVANDGYFNALSSTDKHKYEQRLSLFMLAKDFKVMQGEELEEMPEDIKAILASNAVKLYWNKVEYLMKDWDNFIAYFHPFPSPQYPFLHTIETHEEDEVMLISIEQMVRGTTNKSEFNTALYGLCEAFTYLYPEYNYPPAHTIDMDRLSKLSNIPYEKILTTAGFSELNPVAVAMSHFIEFPSEMQQQYPELYSPLAKILH